MKYRFPTRFAPFVAATLACGAVLGCGGGSGGDKQATAAAQVSPVTEAASAVIAAAPGEASSAAASAAAAASEPVAETATAKAQAAVKATEKPPTAITTTPTAATTSSVSATGTSTMAVATATGSVAVPSVSTALATTSAAPAAVDAAVSAPTQGKTATAAAAPAADLNILGTSYSLSALGSASPNLVSTMTVNKATSSCKLSYSVPESLKVATAAPRPAAGGVFFSNAELATWKSRIASGPFLKANDYVKGSPGDWDRIKANAADFIKNGDKGPTATTASDEFGRLGTTARDAAFQFLLTADSNAFVAVKGYLVAQTKNAAVDFTSLCLTDNANWTPDAYFFQASWLLRYIVTYDFVRSAMTSADRVTVENFIRRNAYYFATQLDYEIAYAFPNRLQGDYTKKLWSAAATKDADMWWFKRYDTNGDCTVDAKDKATTDSVYAYVKADGSVGPRLSVVSQFYNNRRATSALAIGAAGLALADPTLIASAKRYTFEWLTYGVWPDGSQGEFARNGDYCIPQQGVVYSASNTASAALLATLLARQGDQTLVNFKTTDGLFGTQSTGTAPAKTLELAIRTQLGLIHGSVKWFFYQPWRTTQDFSATNAMNGMTTYYMKSTKPLDNYHELSLLLTDKLMPNAKIAGYVLRDKAVTSLPFPGATGNPVTSGWANWTDPFNALPAVLLIRP